MNVIYVFLSILLCVNLLNSPLICLCGLFLIGTRLYKNRKCLMIAFTLGLSLLVITSIRFDFTPKEGTYEILVIDVSNNYFIGSNFGEKFYVYEKETDKEVGDVLRIHGRKEHHDFNVLESDFDFSAYLNNLGIYYELMIYKQEYVFDNLLELNKYKKSFLAGYQEETKAFVNSILFGDKDYDSSIIGIADELNVIFLFSSSGVFINMLFTFIYKIVLLKFSEKKSYTFTYIFFSWFFLFGIAKVSVFRIFISKTAYLFNKYKLNDKYDQTQFTTLIYIVIGICNPFILKQMGFYLGILVSYLYLFMNVSIYNGKRSTRYLKSAALIYLFFLPISVTTSNELSVLGIIFNQLIIPVNAIMFSLSVANLYFLPINGLMNTLVNILFEYGAILSTFNIILYAGFIHEVHILIYYLIFVVCLHLIQIQYFRLVKIWCFVLMFSIGLQIIPWNSVLNSEAISFINVGQGDCVLIEKGMTHILIDTGGNLYKDIANDVLMPYFKKRKIYNIDAIFITHNDYDHNGALSELVSNFNVKRVYQNTLLEPVVINGIMFNNLNRINYNDDNKNSFVFNINILGKKFLLTGDIDKKVEEDLIYSSVDLECDVLKVGHHGSNTSTSLEFLKRTSPVEAVISSGQNSYGHPHSEVINLLNENNIKIRRTDKEGTITYTSFSANKL